MPERCNTCKWYHFEGGIQQFTDGWFLGYADAWGQCDQTGDEVRGDQWCAMYEPHPGLARRNGFDLY